LKGKYNIEVRFIPLGQTYDYFVPPHITVGAAIKLIAETLSKKEGIAIQEQGLVLCDADRKRVLKDEDTLAEAGVSDGVTLMLV